LRQGRKRLILSAFQSTCRVDWPAGALNLGAAVAMGVRSRLPRGGADEHAPLIFRTCLWGTSRTHEHIGRGRTWRAFEAARERAFL